jgi:hypothetical protein
VGPRAVLDMVVKRKIPNPCWESNPRTLIIQPIAQRYTDSAEIFSRKAHVYLEENRRDISLFCFIKNLKFSWQLNSTKSSRVVSPVTWAKSLDIQSQKHQNISVVIT